MTNVIKHDLELPVTVRKYTVDVEGLRTLLRSSKKALGITNRQLSERLDRPITEVEHWFRTDACFSIPDADVWYGLKAVLSIETSEYDAQVTEFIEKPGVFEKAGRFYEIDGIAPTLTVASAAEKIIIREGEEIRMNNALPTQKAYEKKSFTYASAFAGIGGMTLGLKPLGGVGVAAWEYDPTEKRTQYAQEAHRLLHPEIPVHGDICEADTANMPDFDLLCFTPPCQAFSVAGKRGGFEDTRGTLTFEALRIARDKRPKALFMENVKGLVNHDKGDTMSTIIHAINEIGYTVDFTVLNSKYFDVAQNRERVYLIAIRDDLITPEPWNDVKGTTMLPKAKRRYQEEGAKTFNFDWPEQTEVRTRLRDFLEDSVDEKYYLSEDKTAALVKQLEEKAEGIAVKEATNKGYAVAAEGDAVAAEGDAVNIQFPNSKTRRGRVGKQMANTIEASGVNQGVVERVGNVNPSGNGMNGNVYSIDAGLSPTLTTNKGEGIKMLERTDRIIEVGKIKPHRNSSLANSVHSTEGISSTLDTMQGGGREPKILEDSPIMLGHIDLKGHDAIKRVYSPTGQGPTLTTMGGGHREPKIAEQSDGPRYRIRKLTPRECARLQSIPEETIDALLTHFSDSRVYKFCGNGLTTNVITAIGERLVKYL